MWISSLYSLTFPDWIPSFQTDFCRFSRVRLCLPQTPWNPWGLAPQDDNGEHSSVTLIPLQSGWCRQRFHHARLTNVNFHLAQSEIAANLICSTNKVMLYWNRTVAALFDDFWSVLFCWVINKNTQLMDSNCPSCNETHNHRDAEVVIKHRTDEKLHRWCRYHP